MALVALLRGVNVGGHKAFRPTVLAAALKHLDIVNIGAAGTFVVRQPITQAALRAELLRQLPFETPIMICPGRELLDLITTPYFAEPPAGPDVVRFVSVLAARPRGAPPTLLRLPAKGAWLLRTVGNDGRYVLGEYRRHMKVVAYLGQLDKLLGMPATTRNWNTITAIAKALQSNGD